MPANVKFKACPECGSVLCHTAGCATGQAHREDWQRRDAERRALEAPAVNKMVEAPTRKK